MVARETIIQKTSTSLLLESRIVTHWESTVCWLCVLSLELDGLMLKSCIRYISWNMLPKLLELWSPRLKNEQGNPSALLLKPGTWVWLQLLYHQALWTLLPTIYLKAIHFFANLQPLPYIYVIIIISNLECYSKLWTTLPNFCSYLPLFHSPKDSQSNIFNINQIFHLSA